MATADYIDPNETEAIRETGVGSRPLSPTLVASLRLDLAWLDSRRSLASGTSTASEPDHSTSGPLYHQKRRQSIPPSDGTSSPTLASRRIQAARGGGGGERPPLFRRRSRSLDDVTAPEMDRSLTSFGPLQHPSGLRLVCVPNKPVGASGSAAATAPPLSAISLDGSLASLTSSSTNATMTPNAKSSRPRPSRMNGAGGEHGECDDRLAQWVESSSVSTASSTAKPHTLTPPHRASRSTRAASPGHVAMPPTPLHHPNSYAPVLPSPLSTCSYTSADDDDARNGEGESPDTAAPRGFPFPVTPSRISPAAQEPEDDTLCGSGANTRRPTLEARESAETTSSFVTEVDTPQPATSPNGGHPVASPLPGAFTSSRTTTLASTSYVNLHSASDAPRSTASSPIFPSGSSSFSFADADANAYGRRPSVASTSSASAAARSHGAPLTPPDSLSTAPFLFGASAAEMAWHEVLGARYGAGTSVGSGSAGSGGGGGRNGDGAYGYGAGGGGGGTLGHMRRKTDDSPMSAVGGLVAAANVASQSPGSVASPASGRDGNRDASSGPAGGGAGAGATGAERSWSGNELMGCAAGGGYAAMTHEKLSGLLDRHVVGVPFHPADEDKTVQLVEYGALNSRSSTLVRPVLEHFAERELVALRAELTAQHADDSPSAAAAAPGITRRTSDSSNPELDELVSFQVMHVDRPTADFRCLADSLEHDPQSYLRPRPRRPSEAAPEGDWQLEGRVFSAFAARPFGVKAVPRKSVSVGWSVMSLHWPATDRRYRVAPATLAHGELMSFLSARASEFKPGGVLALAYLARTEEAALAASATTTSPSTQSVAASTPSPSGTSGSSPSSKGTSVMRGAKADVWTYMTRLLGKAIQRLVSTGLLKPQVARQLLALPLHPRTPRQTGACLRASAHSWDVLESEMVTLSHPAWKGVEHGTVSIESWADHTIQMLKIFWEDEMRTILRDVLGSRGACEWVLDCLWTVAKEKIEEQPPQPLDLEVQFVALRRRSSSTSTRDVTPSASADVAAA